MRTQKFFTWFSVALVVLGTAVLPIVLAAATPSTVSYQGFLRGANNQPLNGTVDASFAVFDVESDGTPLWSEDWSGLQVEDGSFTVLLGSNVPLDESYFSTPNRWLQITIDDEVLSPRRPLSSVPYAHRSAVADALAGGGTDSDWVVSGNNIHRLSGNVGIGTTTPLRKLDVAGDIKSAGNVTISRPAVPGEAQLYLDRQEDSKQSFVFFDSGTNHQAAIGVRPNRRDISFFIDNARTEALTIDGSNGNVGIGTTSPTKTLDVAGDVAMDVLYLPNTDGSPILSLSRVDTPGAEAFVFYIGGSGYGAYPLQLGRGDGSNRVHVPGDLDVRVLEIRGGADLAEPFDIRGNEPVVPGMVVSIDPRHPGGMRLSDRAYDRTVAGVISGANGVQPGLTLRQEGTLADGARPVALTGRVYTWCDTSVGGPIRPGDLLTSSSTPGHAMRVSNIAKAHGAVIGKAMESLDTGTGLVLVLVNLQ